MYRKRFSFDRWIGNCGREDDYRWDLPDWRAFFQRALAMADNLALAAADMWRRPALLARPRLLVLA